MSSVEGSSSQNPDPNDNGRGKRGKYTGKAREQKLKEAKETGGKLLVNFDKHCSDPYGSNRSTFSRDLGNLARTYLPVRWTKPIGAAPETLRFQFTQN